MAAALPLIETKLVPPRPRPELLLRRRLVAELDRSSSSALTLIDAPVGFGKTVLAQTWCSQTDTAVAWISLDSADDEPARLWTYAAMSVERIRSGLGRGALRRLQSVGAPPEAAVDELINGLAAFGAPLAIVFDDLHLLRDESCLSSLLHAVEHLPAHARMIATTRSDPALPLGRLRARGALRELRAHDLAFTVAEADELLVGRERIPLDTSDVELLVERTEGWPAGLYLAALWLRQLDDPKAGVRSFHGDHRNVADYLSGEVLDGLDPTTRRFLVETATLGRFSAQLCDAALGRSDSGERLREIERSNGFLIALDGHGEWYRYHHLFGELLRLELASTGLAVAVAIHRRASAWCREQGLIEEALEHAAAARDPSLLAAILAEEHRVLLRSGRLQTLLRRVAELPDELLVLHPELPIVAALAAGLSGRPGQERRRHLALAEGARSEQPTRWTPYHEATLGIARMTWVEEDVQTALALARPTADIARQVPEVAVPALASLAFLHFLAGELEEAEATGREAVDRPEAAARPHGLVHALATLSLVETESGHPDVGEQRAREAFAAATEAGVAEVASGGSARVALAAALAGQGKLLEAEREAVHGERLRRHPEPEAGHLHALLVLAGIRARRGQLARAAADLESARRGLERFGDAGRLPQLADSVESTLVAARASAGALLEQPSAAEVSVLRLLATDLSQREIGVELYLSLNTVKTHTRALYRKLGASSREEAVTRATALGLLDAGESPG